MATDTQSPLESVSLLQSLLAAVPAFIVLIDDADRIRYMNRLQSGYAIADALGKTIYDYVPPEYHERHRTAIGEVRAKGGSRSYLTQGAGPDGTIAYYETRVSALELPSGGRQVFLIALEVTEHVARTEALRDSEEKLRIAVEASGIGLWSWDFITGAIEWNSRTHAITGSSVPLDGPTYVERCVHPEDKAKVREDVADALRGAAQYPVHRIVRGDGEVRWVATLGSIDRDEQGRPVRMRGALLDVTEQRQTEEHLRLRQKLDAVGSLTAGVAHNFNNVLAVILPAIETAQADPALGSSPKTRKMLEDAAAAARRAAQLVARLMSSAGQRRAVPHESVDLAALLESVVSMCRQTFDPRCVIELDVHRPVPRISGDLAAIEQVFLNLMLNARDAVLSGETEQPRIVVEVGPAPDGPDAESPRARVEIRDNGVGMSAGVKARLFEPFFSTKPGHGTGLGLATSRATLREHGGTIEISSEAGQGTRCEVSFPALAAAPERAVEASSKDAPARARILIVDDEAPVRSILSSVFALDGHEIFEAATAAAAVAAISGGVAPDLVVLDRSMPGWPAPRAVAELRGRLGKVPIVFFTGQDVPPEEAALVDEVLLKPLSVQELRAAVRRCLARGT